MQYRPGTLIETLDDLRKAIRSAPRVFVVAMLGDFTVAVQVSKASAQRLCDYLASDGRTADDASMMAFARIEHDRTLCIGGL